MLARLALASLTFCLVSACVPRLKSGQVDNPYPLRDFAGPDSLPATPEGTITGITMRGPWRVVGAQHLGGEVSLDHLFKNGWSHFATETLVATVQGLPPEWLVPSGPQWRVNRVDEQGLALGFGFSRPRGNLNFLHYAFVAAPTDINHARGIEAMHFEDTRTGLITWSLWSIDLERLQRRPVAEVEPMPPVWPQ